MQRLLVDNSQLIDEDLQMVEIIAALLQMVLHKNDSRLGIKSISSEPLTRPTRQ